MIIYTTDKCVQCRFLKAELNKNGIPFELCKDENIIAEKKFKSLPVLKLDDGTILSFMEALKKIQKGDMF